MELMLRIGARDAFHDVRCEADQAATVADLISGMRRELAIQPAADVFSHRLQGCLDPSMRLHDAGLLWGDVLELVQPGSRTAAKADTRGSEVRVVVEAVDGPLAGSSWVLNRGQHDIGRSPANKVFLNEGGVALRHATITVGEDGAAWVTAREHTLLDSSVLENQNVRIPAGGRLVVGTTTLTFRAKASTTESGADKAGQILFNRTPHFEPHVEDHVIGRIEQPPQEPTKPMTNWFMILGPLLMGLVLFAFTRQVMTLAFVGMMPLMSLGTSWAQKSEGKKRHAEQRARWERDLVDLAQKAEAAHDQERMRRYDLAPSAEQARQWVEASSTEVWRREARHQSFMHLRMGLGEVKAAGKIEFDRRASVEAGSEDLVSKAVELAARFEKFPAAPIVCDLKRSSALGVWGDKAFTSAVTGALLVQAAALQSPQDLIVCAAVGEDGPRFEFARWLPHANSAASPLEGAHYVSNPLQAKALCEALLSVCEQRAETRYNQGPALPHVLLVVTEEAGVEPATLSRLLDKNSERGVSVMYVAKALSTLPRQCDAVLGGGGVTPGMVRYESAAGVVELVPDFLDPQVCEQVVMKLAPFRDAAAGSAAASIPRQVPLSGIIRESLTSPEAVRASWDAAAPGTLRAPIGLDADGEWLLDVVENGPHGLIAGTSGSGKSELLQSMVVSLAANYPPSMLNFLYVDYKGGAAFGECLELPHSVGMVTDLNEELALRALVSLRAELKRREHVLAGRARDIVELSRIDPSNCPPRLMIVVDEFATLVKEVPDFVAGMVDVAQRGRSLGIHLILATQRPAGSVSDNILANTNLRISLRVLDSSDSSSVIGTSEAAAIPAPLRGRAYVRTGPRDLACVQTAWANAPMGKSEARELVQIFPATSVGRQSSTAHADGPAELSVAVATIRKAAAGMPEPRKPWVEPLGELVLLDEILDERIQRSGSVMFAMADEPESQTQHPVSVDWEADGGLLVLGSGGSGRTTALRTLAGSIAKTSSPEDVALYAIDYNNRAMEQILVLPHTVEVAHADDPERVTAVIAALESHILKNRALLAEQQAASFSELESRGIRAQRAVLFVDDYGAFHAAFEKLDTSEWTTRLHQVVTRGRQAGVHVVLTADRRASIPSVLFSAIAKRVVLRMADSDELIALGVKQSGETPDGRAWLSRSLTCQVAVVSQDASSRGQAEGLKSIAEGVKGVGNHRLGRLPAAVSLEDVAEPGAVVLGECDLTQEKAVLDLDISHFLISGPPRSGRTNLLRAIAKQAADLPGVYVFAIGPESLADDRWLWAGREDAESVLEAVLSASSANDMRCSALLLIDDAEELAEGPLAPRIQQCVQTGGVRVVAASESHFWARAYGGWMADVKRQRRGLFLQPDFDTDAQVASARLRVRPGLVFETGRGIYVADGTQTVVQTPRS